MENEFLGEDANALEKVRDFLKRNRSFDGHPEAFIKFNGDQNLAVLEWPTHMALVALMVAQWNAGDDLDVHLEVSLSDYFGMEDKEIIDAFKRFRKAYGLYKEEELKTETTPELLAKPLKSKTINKANGKEKS